MANLWNEIILRPVLNGLVVLSGILPESVEFGLAIIIVTLVVRLALTPVTIKQTKSTRAMQELQPKMKELQKKYAKNKQKLQQETMKLYKDAGDNSRESSGSCPASIRLGPCLWGNSGQ